MKIAKVMVRGVTAAIVAAALAVPGSVQAAVKYLHMDAFEPIFQPLPGGAYARYYPFASGGRTPTTTLNNYGGCAILRLPVGSVVNEITYSSTGDGGWSYTYLTEFRYNTWAYLKTHMVNPYPAGQSEQTLLSAGDTPVSIRKGYRYCICYEGQPGAAAGSFNHFQGFRIRYLRP